MEYFPDLGLNDETLEMIQDQFKKFTDEEIVPNANEWHLKDDLIPDEILKKMSELGVFSIAIPENYGGLGMGKVAMCVVTEELSRGFLAAGSLGTRAEIAGELIRLGGTEDQKNKYLPELHQEICLLQLCLQNLTQVQIWVAFQQELKLMVTIT